MNDQLILKFPTEQAYKKEDFYVSPSNKEAYNYVTGWPKWIKRIVNIFGPSGSGKSHLASILKSKTTCLHIDGKNLKESIFFDFKTKEVLIIDNLNETVSEELLFSLWNIAMQDNKYLIITSHKPINSYKFKLKDLNKKIFRLAKDLIIKVCDDLGKPNKADHIIEKYLNDIFRLSN